MSEFSGLIAAAAANPDTPLVELDPYVEMDLHLIIEAFEKGSKQKYSEDALMATMFSSIESERSKQRGIVKDLAALQYPEMKDGRPVHDVPLKDGVTDHSTDALRYWAVSRWLTVPQLRKRDPVLSKDKNLGYRIAA